MIRRYLAPSLVLALATALPASADRLQDRTLAASEVMMGKMIGIIKQCAPEISGELGDGSLTPEMREATVCQVQALRDRLGRAKAEEYVSAIEDYSQRDFSTFMEFAEATEDYEILDDDVLVEVGQQCGVIEASMTSSFSQAMSNNPMALAGCFEQ